MTKLSTEYLTWNAKEKTFSTELSSIPHWTLEWEWTLVSHKTGKEEKFRFTDTKSDGEGDLMYYEYTYFGNNPALFGAKLIFFND